MYFCIAWSLIAHVLTVEENQGTADFILQFRTNRKVAAETLQSWLSPLLVPHMYSSQRESARANIEILRVFLAFLSAFVVTKEPLEGK